MKKQKVISTLVGFITIVIAIVVFFGGVFAYQNFATKKNLIIKTPQSQNQTTVWKTYTNAHDFYQFSYPENLVVSTPNNDYSHVILESGKEAKLPFFCYIETRDNPDNLSAHDFANNNGDVGPVAGMKKNRIVEKVAIDGIEAWKTTMDNLPSDSDPSNLNYVENNTLNDSTIFLVRGSKVYVFEVYNKRGVTGIYDAKIFDQIISSFKFVNMPSTFGNSITITSPIGGEQWHVGGTYKITWNAQNVGMIDDITLLSGGYAQEILMGTDYAKNNPSYIDDNTAIKDIDSDKGYYLWTIPLDFTPSKNNIIYITSHCKSDGECGGEYRDESRDLFSITGATNQAIKNITLSTWPNLETFDLVNKTFEAPEVNAPPTKIITDNSTVYIHTYTGEPMVKDYNDFQWLYSLVKNTPAWWITINGVTQSDGSVLANQIIFATQS